MTTQQQYDILLNLHKETLEAINKQSNVIEKFSFAIQKLNDEHKEGNRLLNENTDTLKKMVASNTDFIKLVSRILIIVIGALVVLAGAEKVLKFI
jgi:hypothetical protein